MYVQPCLGRGAVLSDYAIHVSGVYLIWKQRKMKQVQYLTILLNKLIIIHGYTSLYAYTCTFINIALFLFKNHVYQYTANATIKEWYWNIQN